MMYPELRLIVIAGLRRRIPLMLKEGDRLDKQYEEICKVLDSGYFKFGDEIFRFDEEEDRILEEVDMYAEKKRINQARLDLVEDLRDARQQLRELLSKPVKRLWGC